MYLVYILGGIQINQRHGTAWLSAAVALNEKCHQTKQSMHWTTFHFLYALNGEQTSRSPIFKRFVYFSSFPGRRRVSFM